MTKTPYEIRLDILKLAQDQMIQQHCSTRTAWERAAEEKDAKPELIGEYPQYPSTEELLLEAQKLQSFVDNTLKKN